MGLSQAITQIIEFQSCRYIDYATDLVQNDCIVSRELIDSCSLEDNENNGTCILFVATINDQIYLMESNSLNYVYKCCKLDSKPAMIMTYQNIDKKDSSEITSMSDAINKTVSRISSRPSQTHPHLLPSFHHTIILLYGKTENSSKSLIFSSLYSILEGYGSWYYKNGYIYTGQWHHNQWHGEGTLYDPEGTILYSGPFFRGSIANLQQKEALRDLLTTQFQLPEESTFLVFDNSSFHIFTKQTANYYKHFCLQNDQPYFDMETMKMSIHLHPSWAADYIGDPLHEKVAHGYGKAVYSNGEIYEGQWRQGQYEGEGTLILQDGSVYKGHFHHTDLQGTVHFSNGDIFEGFLTNRVFSGQGVYTFKNGDRLEGNFTGKQLSKGTIQFATGDSYEGSIQDLKMDGQGTLFYSNHDVYHGEFKQGHQCGQGVLTYKDGSVYEGAFQEDKRHGFGTLKSVFQTANDDEGTRIPETQVLMGSWKNDQLEFFRITFKDGRSLEGKHQSKTEVVGQLVYADGSIYNGLLRNLKREGKGEMIYADQSRYVGFWKNDKKHGEGDVEYTNHICIHCTFVEDELTTIHSVTYPTEGVYVGDLQNQLRHGSGTLTFFNGSTYTGEWKNDKRNGLGKYTFSTSDRVYDGEWKDNQRFGQGTFTYKDKFVYDGHWMFNLPNGYGTMTYHDGSIYTGTWIDGVRSGYGQLRCSNGDKYEGNWERDVPSGKGVIEVKDRYKYEGTLKNGTPDGFGSMLLSTGEMYCGEWSMGVMQGKGMFISSYGVQVTGTFANSLPHGRCTLSSLNNNIIEATFEKGQTIGEVHIIYSDMSEYFGTLKYNKRDGFGTMIFANQSTYEGGWKNDKQDGDGIYIYADHRQYKGKYKNGKRVDVFESEEHAQEERPSR